MKLIVILVLSTMTISFSSCEKLFDEFKAELLGGSEWVQGDLIITSIGGFEYRVEDSYSGKRSYHYLPSFYSLQAGRPDNVYLCEYYPYLNGETLGWQVISNGRKYWVDPNTGHWYH